MKVGVIGSRVFNNYELVVKTLSNFDITLIISGGAIGADTLGEKYANEHNIPILIFKPDWEMYGKSAGMIRNTDIVDNSDVIVAFWDGTSKGTLDSIKKAEKRDKKVLVITK